MSANEIIRVSGLKKYYKGDKIKALDGVDAVIKSVQSATFIVMEPLLVVTAIYFCLCFPTSKIIAYFERRMSRGSKR